MTNTDEDILPQHYIKELHERFLAMENACIKVKAAVHASGSDFPVYVPTFSDDENEQTSESAREAALKSITQLFHTREGEYIAEAGILCASPKTVTTIEQLNTAKDNFKKAIMAIRAYQKQEDIAVSKIDKLINDELIEKGARTDKLTQAMGTAGIRSLDLKRCYAKIRIMPENLDVFSWTWATNHSRIKKVTMTEALAMARSLPDDEKRATAVDILNQCPPEEVLVRKIGLANQLRANYAFKEGDTIIRKSCPVSGIVIAQQMNMPRKLWRENPETSGIKPDRLTRVSGIENEALVHSLSLYRYVK